MSVTTHNLAQRLDRLAACYRREASVLSVWRGLIALLIGTTAGVALDAALALPPLLRLLALPAALLLAGWLARRFFRRLTTAASLPRLLAHRLEQQAPALDSTISNALDFAEQLPAAPARGVSPELMRAEITLGQERLNATPAAAVVHPPRWREEPRLALGLVLVALLLGVAGRDVVRAVLPRLFDPWGDHPPYHPTQLAVEPAGAVVEYGDSLDVQVRTRGPAPVELQLVWADTNGEPRATLPLYEAAPGLYAQRLENLTRDGRYYATLRGGRSPRYAVTIQPHPRVDTTRYTVEPPPYTHLPAETRLLGGDGIRAYRDSTVTLQFTANRPLRGGTLTLGTNRLDLQVAREPHTVTATFPLTATGTFAALVVDADGHPARQPITGQLAFRPDEAPSITIVSPGLHSFATPGAKVPLNIEARDDLGVARVTLVRNLNDSTDFKKPLHEDDGRRPFINAQETLDLADLGVQPGDVIEYYAVASDLRPGLPQTAASPAFRLMIISDEEFRAQRQAEETAEDLRARYEERAQELAQLAEAQRALQEETKRMEQALTNGAAALTPEQQGRLADLKAAQEKLAAAARQTAQNLAREAEGEPVFDVEKDFKQALAEHAEAVEQAARAMAQGAQQLEQARQQAAAGGACNGALAGAKEHQQQALEQLDPAAKDMNERVAQAGREIEDLFALYQDVEQFKYLLERQRSLERESRTLAQRRSLDAEDLSRVAALGQEQAAVREQLARLKGGLREHAGPAREHYPKVAKDAENIAAAIEELEIEGLMQQAAAALDRREAPQGHAQAKAAFDAMMSLVSQCNGAQGNAQQQCEARLRIQMSTTLGNTFGQLGRGSKPGTAGGQGLAGRGASGAQSSGSMSSPYGLYGPDERRAPKADYSSALGRAKAERTLPEGEAPGLAADVEEVATVKKDDLQVQGQAEDGPLAEYQSLIQAYFKRLAEESP